MQCEVRILFRPETHGVLVTLPNHLFCNASLLQAVSRTLSRTHPVGSVVHLLRWGPPGSCHDWRHFILSGASIRGERHESAMSIVMNEKGIRTSRPPQAVSRGRP
jgi:hypothetical protein